MTEKTTVFLIDDDLDDQEIFSYVMRELDNIKCIFASDGICALQRIKGDTSFSPELIFIDINMPRMNGVECLREIKKIERLRNVPVYMYSTSAEPDIVGQCKKLGAAGYIQKHHDTDAVREQFRKIISQ
jgi:CheY-like chemotaxis protein